MKKLMIAAAIVCVAAFAQAAAIEWMAFDIMDINGESPFSGTATLTVWAEADGGGSATYSGSCDMGMIMSVAGDHSSATAGFIQAGDTYSMQFTMTDADGNIYTSDKLTGVEGMYPSQNSVMFPGGSWAAPEPTSGLLLLVGLGALALRRRRA